MLLWWGCVGANVWKLNGRRWVVSLSDPKASIITGREKFCDLQQLVKILKMSEKCHSQKCFLWLLLKLGHDEGVWVQKSNGSRWVVCLFDPKASIIYSLVWPSKTFQNLQNVNKCHLSPWDCVGENVLTIKWLEMGNPSCLVWPSLPKTFHNLEHFFRIYIRALKDTCVTFHLSHVCTLLSDFSKFKRWNIYIPSCVDGVKGALYLRGILRVSTETNFHLFYWLLVHCRPNTTLYKNGSK